jgi:sec-independent protein translocase protein TatB
MEIGTMELLVILLVAFLVLGPERTLIYARKMGKWLRTLKIYVNSFTDDLKETVIDPLQELQEPLKEMTRPLGDLTKTFGDSVNEMKVTLADKPANPDVKHEADKSGADEIVLLEEAELITEADKDIKTFVPADCEETNATEAHSEKKSIVPDVDEHGRDPKL